MRHHAVITGEDSGRRRIVQIYAIIVVETENNSSKRIATPTPLHNGIVGTKEHVACNVLRCYNLTRVAVAHKVIVIIEIGVIADMVYYACLHYAFRYYPLRIEVHTFYLAA